MAGCPNIPPEVEDDAPNRVDPVVGLPKVDVDAKPVVAGLPKVFCPNGDAVLDALNPPVNRIALFFTKCYFINNKKVYRVPYFNTVDRFR